jgi:hypothetical protein
LAGNFFARDPKGPSSHQPFQGDPIMNPNSKSVLDVVSNRFRATGLAALFALAVVAAGAGCDDDRKAEAEGGEALLSLDTIPDDVNCVRVTITGEFRAVEREIDVVPGTALSESFSGLPVGSVLFSANAFSATCDKATASTIPMWVSEDKTVKIAQGKSSSVTLTLYKNGRAKVSVEFADQEDGGTDAGATGGVDGGAGGG